MSLIADNLNRVNEQVMQTAIRCGRNPASIKLIAISKTHPAESIKESARHGQIYFGENKVQEAEEKILCLKDTNVQWHFIGHLQTNKAKKAVQLFHCIQTVDSIHLLETLQKESQKINKIQDIMIQVNISEEGTKSGTTVKDLELLIQSLASASHLCCKGLMTIPPYFEDPEDVRYFFRILRELAGRYRKTVPNPDDFTELSMGMSHDFATAIEEGATMIRVGTAIFGEREYNM